MAHCITPDTDIKKKDAYLGINIRYIIIYYVSSEGLVSTLIPTIKYPVVNIPTQRHHAN